MSGQEILDYCMLKRGAYIDFPFGEQPLCVKVCKKVFAQIYDDKITLKCEPAFGLEYRAKYENTVVRGYHCPIRQQPYFNTIYLNGKVSGNEMKIMIDHAYNAVINKLSKKEREEFLKNQNNCDNSLLKI